MTDRIIDEGKTPPHGRLYVTVLEDPKLSPNAKLCYAVMTSWGPESRASLKGIAYRMGVTVQTARKAQKELWDNNWIVLLKEGVNKSPRKWLIGNWQGYKNYHPDKKQDAEESHPKQEESKQEELNIYKQEAERLYKLYPSSTVQRRVAKSRKDIERIEKSLREGYPMEEAIKQFALNTDFPKDLKTFLNNLPDPETFSKGGSWAPTPGTYEECKHDLDRDTAKDEGAFLVRAECRKCKKWITVRKKEW